jgi:DNA-binding response OmpR family regulator
MSSGNLPVPAGGDARTDVLLIDDSVADLRLLMEMMTLRDLRVSVALDGERGYQQGVLLRPGLVLLDVRMPGMDGIETCRRLKANPATRSIPVIFLTAANDLAERLEGFAAGAVDYIGKPFEVQEVLARVGVHLQRAEPPAAASPQEPQDPAGGPDAREDAKTDVRLVVAAQKILRETISSPPGLERLARLVGTNRRRLNEAFQALCGQPVFGWLREERLRQANHLVGRTDTPFSTVSDSLGYSTPANFSKAFRLRYGCSPSELRAQLQGVVEADPDTDASQAPPSR